MLTLPPEWLGGRGVSFFYMYLFLLNKTPLLEKSDPELKRGVGVTKTGVFIEQEKVHFIKMFKVSESYS